MKQKHEGVCAATEEVTESITEEGGPPREEAAGTVAGLRPLPLLAVRLPPGVLETGRVGGEARAVPFLLPAVTCASTRPWGLWS